MKTALKIAWLIFNCFICVLCPLAAPVCLANVFHTVQE